MEGDDFVGFCCLGVAEKRARSDFHASFLGFFFGGIMKMKMKILDMERRTMSGKRA